jgi:hypothetical protein
MARPVYSLHRMSKFCSHADQILSRALSLYCIFFVLWILSYLEDRDFPRVMERSALVKKKHCARHGTLQLPSCCGISHWICGGECREVHVHDRVGYVEKPARRADYAKPASGGDQPKEAVTAAARRDGRLLDSTPNSRKHMSVSLFYHSGALPHSLSSPPHIHPTHSTIMSFSVDDLVASLSSHHIGQEAIDLANLQVRVLCIPRDINFLISRYRTGSACSNSFHV